MTPLPDGVVRGTFTLGVVAGLRYETESQSGVTDAFGAYRFRAGETITFSVGGVVLGSATAAPSISPFELAGAPPPTTEAALRAELRRGDDVTAFDRAANIALLLVSLDTDRDHENGLDLGGRDGELADANLDLDAPMYTFADETMPSFAARHGLRRNMPATLPLVLLYDAIEVTIPIHVVAETLTDDTSDGVVDHEQDFTYHASGLLSETRYDDDRDGIAESTSRFSFDAHGRRVAASFETDESDDGVVETRTSVLLTYEVGGALLSSSYDWDANALDAAIDERVTSTYLRDASGNLTVREDEVDEDADGTIDYVSSRTMTYDDLARMLTRRDDLDSDGDGVVDTREDVTFSHDALGRVVGMVTDADTNGDGVVDHRTSIATTYAGDTTTSVETLDLGLDGVDRRQTSTAVYDARGHLLERTRTDDTDGDGDIDSVATETATYDARGNQLTRVSVNDANADGTIDRRETATNTVRADDVRTQRLLEVDTSADGTVDNRVLETYVHDANGNMLSRTRAQSANGSPTVTSVRTFAYVSVPDGLLSLIAAFYGDAVS